MAEMIDLTGQRFGRLTVVERHGKGTDGHALWLCVCECGETTIAASNDLTLGKKKSCGCLRKQINSTIHKTHGKKNTKLYYVWQRMKQRCHYPKSKDFSFYGGRGITVCEEWKNNFQAFYDWAMSNGYFDGLTLDRIDVNGNYEPSNCRWVTMKVQCNNRRPRRTKVG